MMVDMFRPEQAGLTWFHDVLRDHFNTTHTQDRVKTSVTYVSKGEDIRHSQHEMYRTMTTDAYIQTG